MTERDGDEAEHEREADIGHGLHHLPFAGEI